MCSLLWIHGPVNWGWLALHDAPPFQHLHLVSLVVGKSRSFLCRAGPVSFRPAILMDASTTTVRLVASCHLGWVHVQLNRGYRTRDRDLILAELSVLSHWSRSVEKDCFAMA